MEQVFRFQLIQRYRPHSSSVTSRFRRADWRQLLPGRSVFARPAGPRNDVVAFGWSFWFAQVVIAHGGRVDAPPLHWISCIPVGRLTLDGPSRTPAPTLWVRDFRRGDSRIARRPNGVVKIHDANRRKTAGPATKLPPSLPRAYSLAMTW